MNFDPPQFKEAIGGMREACKFFDTPVTGGNVSFYNESPGVAVYPTPVIGMVGLVEDLNHITTAEFKDEGDLIYLLGIDYEEVGGSEYLKVIYNEVKGNSPKLDLQTEKDLQDLILKLIRMGLIKSAHDISEGGILTTLAECAILNRERMIGAEVEIPVLTREDFSFFSESQSRVIVSVGKEKAQGFEELAAHSFIPFVKLGETGGSSLRINRKYEFSLNDLSEIYFNSIAKKMNAEI